MIIKIGGSILSNLDDLDLVAQKICEFIKVGNMPIIAISAFKNYTNELIRMNTHFSNDISSFIVTVGEQITAGLFALALQKYGYKAKPLAGWQVPIIIGDKHEDNLYIDKAKIENLLNQGTIPIIAGYQGMDENNEVKDLGRGGTDLTAVYLAKAFEKTCILLKKSNGVCSADPELINSCFVWNKLGYDNLLYLAESGSRIVQKDALLIAKKYNVRLKVAGLEFAQENAKYTDIGAINQDFWSIFEHGHKLRIITTKKMDAKEMDFLLENGFEFNGEYYQFKRSYFDLKLEANRIYKICMQMI